LPSQPRRSIAKTASYKSIMLVVIALAGFTVTGSWQVGGLLAIIDLVLGLIIFYYHERLWSKIKWGKG